MIAPPKFQRIIDLQEFLLKFQAVDRVIKFEKNGKHYRENDIEHSYSLAMVAWYLVRYFPELDRDLVIRYALVHDLVEVYAGDTYIFADKKTLNSKQQREHDAELRIRQEWKDFPEMNSAIVEYESRQDNESRFVYAIDKIMPIILNIISKGYTWHEENIILEELHNQKMDKVNVSKEIKPYYDAIYDFLLKNQHLFPSKK